VAEGGAESTSDISPMKSPASIWAISPAPDRLTAHSSLQQQDDRVDRHTLLDQDVLSSDVTTRAGTGIQSMSESFRTPNMRGPCA